MSRSLRILVAVLALASLAAAHGCAYLDIKQREFIFRPSKDNWGGYQSGSGPRQEMWIALPGSSAGDDRIQAWWLPSEDPAAPAVLYLHGARWNLSGSSYRIERWQRMGFSVLAIDYRGFGKSSGELPSEEQAYEDAQAAWTELKKLQPDAKRRYAYGHSLGGAVAIELAANNPDMAGLIAEATFTSIRDMAAQKVPGWLPLDLVLTQRFDSIAKVGRLRMPVLFIHGTADRIVPHAMSEQLFAAAPEPKRLVLVAGGGHSNISWSLFEQYQAAIAAFRKSVETPESNSVSAAPGG